MGRATNVAAVATVLLAAACSSTSKVASGPPASTTATTAAAATTSPSVSTTTAAPSTSTTAAASSAPLPDPCTLLTKDDVAPLFGTTALDTTPGTAGPGAQLCSFGLSVGSQGLNVTVRTFDNYRSNPGYVFPAQGTPIGGLGDEARLSVVPGNVATLSVKLGGNVLEIHVEFYTKPVDQSFVETLARKAVGRLPH